MLQFMKKINGSVSIFLLAIMLPMLVFSFTVVDLCRIFTAQDVIADAADTGVNSALTSYDKVLKDMYGLMATSSSEEELSEKIAEYYAATLSVNGVTLSKKEQGKVQELILSLLNDANNSLTEEDIKNSDSLLNIKAETGDSGNIVDITPIKSSAASNPKVMKREIVEYMKYRGPAMIVNGILSKINALSDLPNQAKAAEAKIDFDKSLSEIGKSSQDIYTMLRIYEHNCIAMETPDSSKQTALQKLYAGSNKGSSEDELMKMYQVDYNSSNKYSASVSDLKAFGKINDIALTYGVGFDPNSLGDLKYRSYYFCMQDLLLKNGIMCYTIYARFFDKNGNLKTYKVPSVNYDASELTKKLNDLVEDKALNYYVEIADNINLSNFSYSPIGIEYLKGFLAESVKGTDVENNYEIIKAFLTLYDSSANANVLKYSSFPDSFNEFMACYEAGKEELDSYNEEVERKKEKDKDYKEDKTEEDDHFFLGEALDDTSEMYNKLNTLRGNVEKNAEGARSTLVGNSSSDINRVINNMTEFYYNIYCQYQLLEKLTSGDSSLRELVGKYKEAEKKAEDFDESTKAVQDTSAKTNLESQVKTDAGDLLKDANGEGLQEACDKMISTLNEQKKNYKQALNWMDHHLVYMESIFENIDISKTPDKTRDISKHTYDTNKIINHIYENSDIFSDLSSLLMYAENNIDFPDFQYKDACDDIDSGKIVSWKNYIDNFDTSNGTPTSIHENKMYKQVEKAAKPTHETKKDSTVKDKIDEMGKTDENGNTAAMSSSGVPDSSGGSGSSDNSLAKLFNTEKLEAYDIQKYSDFIAEYLNTEAEKKPESNSGSGSKKEPEGDDKDDKTANKAKGFLAEAGDFIAGLAKAGRDSLLTTEYIANAFSCHTTDIKDGVLITDDASKERNIMGEMFPAKTNSYRGEIEYILYGFDNNAKNVAAASGVIFGVRFVLNLIYSFTDGEINEITTTAATASVGALPFLVPLVKVVLHIGFAIAESGYDVVQLLKGKDVPIFKSADTWVCKPTGIGKAVAGEVEDLVGAVAATAVDAAADGLSKMIDEGSTAVKDGAGKLVGEAKTYADEIKNQAKETIKSDIEIPFENKLQELALGLTGKEEDFKERVVKGLIDTKAQLIESLENTENGEPSIIEETEINVLNLIDDQMLERAATKFTSKLDDYINSVSSISLNGESSLDVSADGSGLVNGVKSFVKKNIFDELYSFIDNKIDTDKAFGKIETAVGNAVDNVSKAAKDKVISGKETIKEKINSETHRLVAGTKSQKSTVSLEKPSSSSKVNLSKDENIKLDETKKSGKTVTLTMNYKEYLYVFTVIGLLANEDNMLQRTAQLMAANCREGGAGSDYQLNDAATLVSLTAKGSVKTVFYGAVFKDGKLDFSGKPDRYTFSTTTYMGY